jgi:hypothetical protein
LPIADATIHHDLEVEHRNHAVILLAATVAHCNSASTIAVSHHAVVSPPLPITTAAVHHGQDNAHCYCAAVTPSIAWQLPSPIAMLLPLLSPIAATAVHGNSHHNCAAVSALTVAPPLLSPIINLVPLALSPIITPAVTHCHHHRPSQLRRCPAVHCAVDTIVYCNRLSTVAHCRCHRSLQQT